MKRLRAHKSTHKQTLNNKTKMSELKNNKGNGFLCAQTSKGVKVACFAFVSVFVLVKFFRKKNRNNQV